MSAEELDAQGLQAALAAGAAAAVVELPGGAGLTPGPPPPAGPLETMTPGPVTRAVEAAVAGDLAGTLVLLLTPAIADAAGDGLAATVQLAMTDALAAIAEAAGLTLRAEAPSEVQAADVIAAARGAVFAAVPLLDGERHVATLVLLVDARPRPAARAEEPAGVQPHQFEALAPQPGAPAGRRSLDLLRDVEMGVTAELGRARMTVRNLLELAPGAVVELDRAAGSPIDVLVNGTLVARGEVVVIGEEFGVRITEIVGPDADERGPGR